MFGEDRSVTVAAAAQAQETVETPGKPSATTAGASLSSAVTEDQGAMAAGSERYMTCPDWGDRVPIAEDVSRSLEPGAYLDSMLVTSEPETDDEYRLPVGQCRPGPADGRLLDSGRSGDSEAVEERLNGVHLDAASVKSAATSGSSGSGGGAAAGGEDATDGDGDITATLEWKDQQKHIFVLSESGKPVYSRHGSEEQLVTLSGVMQALVSFVQDSGDSLRALRTGDRTIAFLSRPPLILVAVSRGPENVHQLNVQLFHVYYQILSVVTKSQLTRISEQRRNFDFRKLVSGAERFLDQLVAAVDARPDYLLQAVQCLRLEQAARDAVVSAVQSVCSKIKDLVFALLISGDRLISLVRIRSHYLHPTDYHIVCNIVTSTESFKTVEGWIPICLPKFDSSGFMYAYVSYLSEECPACLVLLTADRESFHALAQAKSKITERLHQNGTAQQIAAAIENGDYPVQETGVLNMRHFMYKCKSTAQSTCPSPSMVYGSPEGRRRLYALYHIVHGRVHSPARPLKTYYFAGSHELVVGWVSPGFELYTVFDPHVSQQTSITEMNRLLRWIKDHERRVFILSSPVF
ncbi:protein SAND-like isoform X3 [Amphibalanus amphitrite]|uniref:protein SAND-like isoform X3 n=1 Tax=Amphibalanus amphitrite TaxID=1232801 RepID=UPI001C90B498|nr:protein SAND-like isoform X3 [Amphibalanus amphitrite]